MKIWNSLVNGFQEYEPKYETKTETVDGEKVEKQVEIPFDGKLYTDDEVQAIFSTLASGQVLKDNNGAPSVVELYMQAEKTAMANIQKIAELKKWFNTYFATQLEQHSWQTDYKPSYDEYFKTIYSNWDNVVAKANEVRTEIKRIELLV